jgi:hypothetical protein
VKTWAAANEVEFVNAEFGKFDINQSDLAYDTYPGVIDAFAKGAGGGGTIWTFTRGVGWRINIRGGDTPDFWMRPEIKSAFTAAIAYIRAQPDFGT